MGDRAKDFVVYKGFGQERLDQNAAKQVRAALAKGYPVVLIGTKAARPLAAAVGLSWLHELPQSEPRPQSFAWDPEIAEAGGPLLGSTDAVVVLAAGSLQWVQRVAASLADSM